MTSASEEEVNPRDHEMTTSQKKTPVQAHDPVRKDKGDDLTDQNHWHLDQGFGQKVWQNVVLLGGILPQKHRALRRKGQKHGLHRTHHR